MSTFRLFSVSGCGNRAKAKTREGGRLFRLYRNSVFLPQGSSKGSRLVSRMKTSPNSTFALQLIHDLGQPLPKHIQTTPSNQTPLPLPSMPTSHLTPKRIEAHFPSHPMERRQLCLCSLFPNDRLDAFERISRRGRSRVKGGVQ